jgi:hypothetical protein
MQAEKCWKGMTDEERRRAVLGLDLWKWTVQWQSNGGLFIPYGSTFLHQKRYLDEPWQNAFKDAGIE